MALVIERRFFLVWYGDLVFSGLVWLGSVSYVRSRFVGSRFACCGGAGF